MNVILKILKFSNFESTNQNWIRHKKLSNSFSTSNRKYQGDSKVELFSRGLYRSSRGSYTLLEIEGAFAAKHVYLGIIRGKRCRERT